MAAKKPRVVIPRNPELLIKLLKKVVKKHQDDAVKSPLKDFDMSKLGGMTTEADKQHTDGEDYRKKAEACTQLRDKALGLHTTSVEEGTALWVLMSVRDLLMGLYKGKEQKLGEWGFEVDASVKARPAKNGSDSAKK